MISALMRQNPAVRTLAKWAVFTAVASALALNLVTMSLVRGGDVVLGLKPSLWFVLLAWFAVALYLVLGSIGTRCSSFDMTLPVSTRQLWIAHVLTVSLGGLVLLAVMIAVATGGGLLMLRIADRWVPLTTELRHAAVALVAGFFLAAAILEMRAPTLQKVPSTRANTAQAVATVSIMLAAVILMTWLPVAVAIIPVAAAVALGIRRYLSLPISFSVAPDQAEAPTAAEAAAERRAWEATPARGLRASMLLAGVVYRTLYRKKAAALLIVPFMAGFGALISGADEVWFGEMLHALMIPMVAYALLAFVIDPLSRVGRLDAFPISRGRVLALLSAPMLISLALGYGVGRVSVAGEARKGALPEPVVLFQGDDAYYYLRVPISFCEIAWAGDVPMNESPWGEAHPAWSAPLYRGSAIRLYSPFSVGAGASIDFTALQISRAADAIFGEAITPEEVKSRYLRARSDGSAELQTEALTLERDHPEWRRRSLGPVFPVMMALSIGLWLVSLVVFFGGARAGKSIRRRMARGFVLMGVLFGLYGAQVVAAIKGFMEPWAAMGFLKILTRHAGETFAGSAVVWVACAAVLAGGYALALWRFESVEAAREAGDRK